MEERSISVTINKFIIQINYFIKYLYLNSYFCKMILFQNKLITAKDTKIKQYVVSVTLIFGLSLFCYIFKSFVDYRIVALVLLLAVSILAILYDIIPVMLSAVLSSLILNFFFIPPILHYKINDSEDILLFFIFLFISSVNAFLTNKIRKQENKINEKEEKEKILKLYETILNSLSHELRTPISTIIGSVDTLKSYNDVFLTQQKDELLSEIEKASMRLDRQVENLLNMSRLKSGNFKLKKDWTDVNELIFMAIGKINETAERNIIFIPDEELPLFKIDEGLMIEVVHGLLHNAVIHNTPDTIINIEAAYENEKLKIIIRDDGKGFPKEEIPKVFDKFYRLPHSKSGSLGLGLSIVKGFVEAHNGTVSLNSKQDEMSEFTIYIPSETSFIKNLKNE